MSVLDKLKAEFLPQLKELKKYECSEIGEVIYFRTVANTLQTDKYWPLLNDNKIEGYVELVMSRALNEDGTRMFAPKDKQELMKNVNPLIITDIGNAILGVDNDEQEQANKETAEAAKK